MKKIAILFSFLLFSISAFSQIAAESIESTPENPITTYVLENGLTIILNPDSKANTVYGMVAVKAGAKHDPADATGIAHYLEHLLFKGTQKIGTTSWEEERIHNERIIALYDELALEKDPTRRREIQLLINAESVEANKFVIPNELDKILRSFGSTGLNAFTSEDMTAYFNEFPPAQIERWLRVYSDRFINPVFRSFQAELEVVYEEYNMYQDMFFFPLLEEFKRNFFRNHQYGQQSIIGSMEHLKYPSLTKMQEFYDKYYVSNNKALILSGNFNEEDVKPLIEKYFGRWQAKEVADFEVKPEEPFIGREIVEVKMSPIKIGILGFRTPGAAKEDRIVVDILTNLLSNSNQTGLLDRLVAENKLMMAQCMPFAFKDHGAIIILFAPKLIGQSHKEAEQLIIDEINKIKSGLLTEEQIEKVKKSIYVNYQLQTEDHMNMTVQIATAFINQIPLDEVKNYPTRLMEVTKANIIETANKYLSDNYLGFFSSTGFPKKAKIEKPGFEPLKKVTTTNSKYFYEIINMPNQEISIEPAQYFNLVSEQRLNNKAKFYFVENPYNTIGSFTKRFYIDSEPNQLLSYAVRAMNHVAIANKDKFQLKEEFAKLGLTLSFSFDDGKVDITIQGVEENIYQGITLLTEILNNPIIDETTIKLLHQEDKASRKLETSDANSIANLLLEYVIYGEKSSYLNRPSIRKVKNLKPKDLVAQFKTLLNESVEYHYVGTINHVGKVTNALNDNFSNLKPADHPIIYDRTKIKPTQNKIYFTHKKNTIQSKVFFYQTGPSWNVKFVPKVNLFNEYFGGGFSGLLMREIREYRSLAYTTGGRLQRPSKPEDNFVFIGSVGTQADKTEEAISVFLNLLNNMPQNIEDIDFLRESMLMSMHSNIPNFRNKSFAFARDKQLGWDFDPLMFQAEYYQQIKPEHVIGFWENHIKGKPLHIIVVADRKRLDPKALNRFFEVEQIKPRQLFTR